jgi:hypothetical protein
MPPTLPTCFFVGAPKAASTSLASFLREHPAAFVPELKELRGLAPDVYPESIDLSKEGYLAHFAGAPASARCIAEASPLYLYSSQAPQRIVDLNPEARIVIVLRDPVQLVRSLHMQNVKDRVEPFFELELALGAEPLRAAGIAVPRNHPHTTHAFLHYCKIASYAPQLRRYFAVFPRQQVHVVIFERLLKFPQRELSRLLEFLGLAVPEGDLRLPRDNTAVSVRHSSTARLIANPPAPARSIARLLPAPARAKLVNWLWSSNILAEASRSLPVDLELYLRKRFVEDVGVVEELLGLELSEWKAP